MMNKYGEHAWGFGHSMGWWWLIGLVFMVIIVWVVLKVLNQNKNSNTRVDNKSALDILKERYARGEIDKQEFEERKKDLM